ncbi:uncharacterized protein [Rutidosis leptorrhynchoides]|uniref:uncharacterized protein n=1 Tax=Rutidosis leptorrhynchoides TaxID=125765 RepID=UPI003A993F3D
MYTSYDYILLKFDLTIESDELEIVEEYFINVTRSLLCAYKDALEPAINNVKKHMMNLKRYEKAIDPDEEFLQDIERRHALEQEYLAAETKVFAIFDAAENVKEQFYLAIDNVSRKGIEPINELCDAIEKVRVNFESLPKPFLRNDKSTEGEKTSSKESPKKGASPSSKLVLSVDLKSILTQKLVTRSPNNRPYIPLGGSTENSPSKVHMVDDTTMNIEKENKEQLILEHGGKMDTAARQEISMSQCSTGDEKKLSEKEDVNPETSTSNDEKLSTSATSESDKPSDTDDASKKQV